LKIGHHLLEGKFVSLSKPLAVLSRVDNTDRDDVEEAPDIDVDGAQRKILSKAREYDAIAIIKKKITFSKRPTPIVKLT